MEELIKNNWVKWTKAWNRARSRYEEIRDRTRDDRLY